MLELSGPSLMNISTQPNPDNHSNSENDEGCARLCMTSFLPCQVTAAIGSSIGGAALLIAGYSWPVIFPTVLPVFCLAPVGYKTWNNGKYADLAKKQKFAIELETEVAKTNQELQVSISALKALQKESKEVSDAIEVARHKQAISEAEADLAQQKALSTELKRAEDIANQRTAERLQMVEAEQKIAASLDSLNQSGKDIVQDLKDHVVTPIHEDTIEIGKDVKEIEKQTALQLEKTTELQRMLSRVDKSNLSALEEAKKLSQDLKEQHSNNLALKALLEKVKS